MESIDLRCQRSRLCFGALDPRVMLGDCTGMLCLLLVVKLLLQFRVVGELAKEPPRIYLRAAIDTGKLRLWVADDEMIMWTRDLLTSKKPWLDGDDIAHPATPSRSR